MDGKLRSMTSVYFVRDDQLLCLFRLGSQVADKMYVGAAGGHFLPKEVGDARACLYREMREELDLQPDEVEGLTLRYVTLRLKNGQIRQNYYFFAHLRTQRSLTSTEGNLQWIALDQLFDYPMPASAKMMLKHYVSVGRFDSQPYGGVAKPESIDFYPLTEFGD